jgi:cysteinyl-tRNA synthetase
MDDDFNTPVAIAALFELAAAIYRLGSAGSASDSNPAAVPEHARLASRAQTMAVWRALLRELAAHLGLLDQDLNRVRTGGLRGSGGKSESARRNALPGLEPVPAHSADQNAVHNPQHRAGHHAEHNDGYSAEQAEDWIQHLVDQRSLAKKARDFPRADALREELAQAGIVLEDSPQGTRWRRA